jgi:hypothetical protein
MIDANQLFMCVVAGKSLVIEKLFTFTFFWFFYGEITNLYINLQKSNQTRDR